MSGSNVPKTLAIDFGTSNSAAGYMGDDGPELIEIETGETTLPTSIFFDFATGETLFGNPANMALIDGLEGRFMRALKSVLGTSLVHESRQIMNQELTFIDIISQFLSQLKTRAENATGQRFDAVLSGRPVHFHSADSKKDKQALVDLTQCYHQAGFERIEFMYEPEAAALAHGSLGATGKLGLIVDIGGGTSDFTVFRSAGNVGIEVLASHGVRIGGTDFDKSLSIDHVMPLFGKGSQIGREMGVGSFAAPNAIFQELATWQKIQFLYSPQTRRDVADLRKLALQPHLFKRLADVFEMELGHDIAFAVERGKIDANRAGVDTAKISLGVVEPELSVSISTADLSISLGKYAGEIRASALETLEMAGCRAAEIDAVIFVGGSSLMSVIEQAMSRTFPTAMLSYGEAFTAIIDGLTIASGQRSSPA